jgi:ketosteroid isomerase-like protein
MDERSGAVDETSVWLAKAAIAELITRYAALNDAGDWDGVAALYAEDGRMSRPTAPEDFIAGRAAILAAFRSRPLRATRHIVANVLVTLDSESEARATSQILLFTGALAGEGLPVQSAAPPLVGSYRDRLTRTHDGWRFLERRGSLDFRIEPKL